MPTIIDTADAAVEALNAPAFALGCEAERFYRPVFNLPDLDTLHVTVVPRGLIMARAARGLSHVDMEIDVAVQQKLAAEDRLPADEKAALDALVGLVQRIADLFRNARLKTSDTEAVCLEVRNEPIYSPEHLEQYGQFTSVLTLTFRVLR